ncbi:hypothetical protein E2320_006934 [Naja naja]|nr:hypothetical protein E2320_006934 [Naja naja]
MARSPLFLLLLPALLAAPSSPLPPCPAECQRMRCPPRSQQACLAVGGELQLDRCGCCWECAPGEGQPCAPDGLCARGFFCHRRPDSREPGTCSCVEGQLGVCGSDGRTYSSLCQLRARNHQSSSGHQPLVVPVHKGNCGEAVHLELFRSGSGFIVSEDGLILTNAHVLNKKQRIKVELKTGHQVDAQIEDVDHKLDIALIKIDTQFVVALGSPFSLQNTVTTGIVSSTQRDGRELGMKDSDMEYIQTDAIINYGNSGGPLVNLDGEVIGMNTLKVTAGISFAIPSDRIRHFLEETHNRQVKGKTIPKKKYLGLRMVPLTFNLIHELRRHNRDFPKLSSGVYVRWGYLSPVPGDGFYRAGLKDGDVIIAINEKQVTSTHEVTEAVRNNSILAVIVRRGNEDIILTVTPDQID